MCSNPRHQNGEVKINSHKALPDTFAARSHTSATLLCWAYPSQLGRRSAPLAALPPYHHGNHIPPAKQADSRTKVEKLCVFVDCHSLLLFPPGTPFILSLPLSAGNRCPASHHKYLLITIAGDSWSTQTDNLWARIQFSHIRPSRGQMGLPGRRVTDYFEVLPGCLVKAPGLQSKGPQERREGERGRRKDRDQSGEEKKGKEKPEASRGNERRE